MGHDSSQQFLQVVLLPGQSLITSEQCIYYSSCNMAGTPETLVIQERFNFRQRLVQYLTGDFPKLGCLIANKMVGATSSAVNYVGLSLSTGRIIVHEPIENDMYFRIDSILCHTQGVQLVKNCN